MLRRSQPRFAGARDERQTGPRILQRPCIARKLCVVGMGTKPFGRGLVRCRARAARAAAACWPPLRARLRPPPECIGCGPLAPLWVSRLTHGTTSDTRLSYERVSRFAR